MAFDHGLTYLYWDSPSPDAPCSGKRDILCLDEVVDDRRSHEHDVWKAVRVLENSGKIVRLTLQYHTLHS
jgi:hypothetical protein